MESEKLEMKENWEEYADFRKGKATSFPEGILVAYSTCSVLDEVHRVLKAGGRLILQLPNKSIYGFFEFLREENGMLADDPTHVRKYSWRNLRDIISDYFDIEDLSTRNIFLEKKISPLKKIRKSSGGLAIGQKTIIVARKRMPSSI
ncbi:MAG: hypothetical protein GXO71_06380 [Caldiserica bacterium]|nr:hypothetical protein [Caldisericota bacterium]